MNLAHLHLLLNHFPTIGVVAGLGLFITALAGRSEDLKRASLVVFVLIALLSFPAYVTGLAAKNVVSSGEETVATLVSSHEDAALLAFVLMQFTGLVAWIGLWRYSRVSETERWNVAAILVLGVLTLALMARAASIGGEIRHPEIASTTETAVAASNWLRSASVATYVIDRVWVWPAAETLHFIGLGLLFSVVVVNLRLLGVMKKVPFVAVHRLLPWTILGFVINTITGMVFFIAAADQYTLNIAFYLKLLFIILSGINVLYLTVSPHVSAIGSGDDAPFMGKIVGAAGIFVWMGVIVWGRLLPFLGWSF